MNHHEEVVDAQALWQEYQVRPSPRLREQLIHRYRPLARAMTRRFCTWYDEDVEQVALLGLIRAIDRYDPSRDNGFSAFAVPTIVGEVRHYLRDHSRLIRYPRDLDELRRKLRAAEARLAGAWGRAPTVPELAEALGIEVDQITELIAAEESCRPYSLDAMVGSEGEDARTLQEYLGERDRKLERVEAEIAWDQILDLLQPPLKRVIQLRYFHGLTQSEVGCELGCSQMRISRLERQALALLRARLSAAYPAIW